MRGEMQNWIKPYAKRSVAIFISRFLVVMLYATAISKTVGLIQTQFFLVITPLSLSCLQLQHSSLWHVKWIPQNY